jgi:hypothetical protein
MGGVYSLMVDDLLRIHETMGLISFIKRKNNNSDINIGYMHWWLIDNTQCLDKFGIARMTICH